jgi:hypothetical protein
MTLEAPLASMLGGITDHWGYRWCCIDRLNWQGLSAPHDVAAVGFAVGYDSPQQSSREYGRLFGTLPGQDGEHLRRSKEISDAAYRTSRLALIMRSLDDF